MYQTELEESDFEGKYIRCEDCLNTPLQHGYFVSISIFYNSIPNPTRITLIERTNEYNIFLK